MAKAAVTTIAETLRRPGAGLSLTIDRVSHAYPRADDELPVLDEVSLHLEAGSFTALVGPPQCGKSTLLRLAAGLDKPTAGHVDAGGAAVETPHASRTLMFSDATLFPWRTIQAKATDGQTAGSPPGVIDARLSHQSLHDYAKAYPHQRSGGTAQRAALARALIDAPAQLLLDDPFGTLDAPIRAALQDELAALWHRQRVTVLLVTGDIEEALLLASRVIVLGPRPARVLTEIAVDKPYPRHRDDPDLVALRGTVHSAEQRTA